MWEPTDSPSRTFLVMRRIVTYLLAAGAATFLCALFISPNTYAADATWSDSATITYQENSHKGPAEPQIIKNLKLPDGTKAYTYLGPAPEDNLQSVESAMTASANKNQIMSVIFFEKNVDVINAKTAKYMTAETTGGNNYRNLTNPINITVDPTAATKNQPSSCSVSGGLSWIICPISNTLAGALDKAYDVLSEFLNVKPVSNDTNSTLFRAWSYMRSFANVAFVIAFLIIIYSQLTSFGISNYGIKKLLPRLIVAALLVNLSYYICSIGVDLSNILGHSVQDVLMNIRNGINVQTNQASSSFANVTGVVLAGGTTLAVGGSILVLYGVVGSIYLLLPALISGFVAVLVALVVIAGRQAMITVLIIVSPLAFVAYLLPNTEKWFEKWQSTFMTLLILFPAFSLVYGGSQLAAAAIIQNADSWNVMILGLFVQVAPLMITPMLIKLSGSTLGKLADFASNPGKKLTSAANSLFRDDLANSQKAKRLSQENVGRFNPLRLSQRADRSRRDRKFALDSNEAKADTLWRERSKRYRKTDLSARQFSERKSLVEASLDNSYKSSSTHEKLYESAHNLDTEKSRIEQTLDRNLKNKIRIDSSMLEKEMQVRVVTDEAATAKARIDKVHEDLRAGKDSSVDQSLGQLITRSERATRDIALTGIATQMAKKVQQDNLANSLLSNTASIDGQSLREYAGGIEGDKGADSALANAISVQRDAFSKIVNERNQLMRHFNLSGAEMQNLAMGKENVVGAYKLPDGTSIDYTFQTDDKYIREAAIETQLKIGSFNDVKTIIENSGTSLKDYKTTIATGMAMNGVGSKGLFFGGKTIDDAGQGKIKGHADIVKIAAKFILDGKFKAEDLANNDAEAITIFTEAASNGIKEGYISNDPDNPTRTEDFKAQVERLKEMAAQIIDPDLKVGMNKTDAAAKAFKKLKDI